MKTCAIYFALFFLCLNSCSKAPNDGAAANAQADYPDTYQDSIGGADTATATVDTATATEYPNIDSEKYNQNHQQSTDLNEDNGAKTSPAISGGSAVRDSVRAGIKKITPILAERKIEVITPDFSKTVETDSQVTVLPPPPKSDEEIAMDAATIEEKPQNAVLGFSYFPQIPQNETRDLRVFVKVQGDEKHVAKKLKAIEKEDMEFTKTDDSSVVCIIKNIEAFQKLSVKPIYDVEDFRVTRVDEDVQGLMDKDPNEQVLDFKNGNYWHWKVKAIAKDPHMGNITLRIKAETPEGLKIQLAERQINIKIGIDKPKLTFTEKVYQFADNHFKEILSLIIIPLVLYLFNLLRKRFIVKKANDGEPGKS